jgi:ribosomal protein L37E
MVMEGHPLAGWVWLVSQPGMAISAAVTLFLTGRAAGWVLLDAVGGLIPAVGLYVGVLAASTGVALLNRHGVASGAFGAARGEFERLWQTRCHRCGYDLRTVNLPRGTCPECGPPPSPGHEGSQG